MYMYVARYTHIYHVLSFKMAYEQGTIVETST